MKSDYAEIAGYYDRYRSSPPAETRFWLDTLVRLGGLQAGTTILDAGCGTGRFALPLAADYGLRVIGIDREPAMLAKGAAKAGSDHVLWMVGDAQSLPVAGASVDALLMCMMLHHVEDRPRALRAALAALRPGGRLVIWTSSHRQIQRFLLTQFFPGLVAIDAARFPRVPALMGMMRAAGFEDVRRTAVTRHETVDKAAFLERVKNRYISTLSLISEGELAEGTAELERHLACLPGDRFARVYHYTFVTGTRPYAGGVA